MLLAVGLAVVSLLALGALSAWGARHRDVSTRARYAARVGQKCVVLRGLRAHGWSLNYNDDVTHRVDVTTLPGIAGPEITFKTPIPRGTTFVITSVRECWNCPFDRISYRAGDSSRPGTEAVRGVRQGRCRRTAGSKLYPTLRRVSHSCSDRGADAALAEDPRHLWQQSRAGRMVFAAPTASVANASDRRKTTRLCEEFFRGVEPEAGGDHPPRPRLQAVARV